MASHLASIAQWVWFGLSIMMRPNNTLSWRCLPVSLYFEASCCDIIFHCNRGDPVSSARINIWRRYEANICVQRPPRLIARSTGAMAQYALWTNVRRYAVLTFPPLVVQLTQRVSRM